MATALTCNILCTTVFDPVYSFGPWLATFLIGVIGWGPGILLFCVPCWIRDEEKKKQKQIEDAIVEAQRKARRHQEQLDYEKRLTSAAIESYIKEQEQLALIPIKIV